jgi:hypothetical protein
MRMGMMLPLLALPLFAAAQTPDEDEKRVEQIVRERYGPTQAEIEELAAQGLGPDGQPLIDPATGLPVEPGAPVLLTPSTEEAVPVPDPAATAEPPPDLPPVGTIAFEDLSKLIGYWVKVKTYTGRIWQGQVKVVKGNEVQLNVPQRGGAATMTLKKNAIANLERI